MNSDHNRALKRRREHNPNQIDVMKSIFESKTMWGLAVTLGAKLLGLESADVQSVVDHSLELWPVLIGIVADLGAAWSRLRQSHFDGSALTTPTFWLQALSMGCTLAAALGVDAASLQEAIQKGLGAWPSIAALLGSVFAVWGQAQAKRKLKVMPSGTALWVWLLMLLPMAASAEDCVAVRVRPSMAQGIARLWSQNDKLWGQESLLRVAFLSGSRSQQDKAWREFQEVDALVNLTLIRSSDPDAEIRVRFDAGLGHWSYVGTDCLKVKRGQPTMNIALGSMEFRSEWRRVAQHELMHALGFEHEHQSPVSDIPWDRAAVYAWYGRTQGWSKSQIDYQVLKRYGGGNWNGTAYDPTSIMQYPVEAAMTGGRLSIGWNNRRSALDDAELRRRYPN